MPAYRRRVRNGQISISLVVAAALLAAVMLATRHGANQESAQRVEGSQPVAMSNDETSVELTETETDDDFPAAAVGPDGTTWCVYVSYQRGTPIDEEQTAAGHFESLQPKGNGDQICLMRLSDGEWSVPVNVTGAGLDVWRPQVVAVKDGRVWIVWSQQVEGNWDLYARHYRPEQSEFGPIHRLTDNGGADINAAVAATQGGLWIAWQAKRDGDFDIRLARLSRGALENEQQVSTSSANDWSPAIAATAQGDLWVAWDTYDKGDYDVFARRFSDGRLDEPTPIANSTRFEARPQIIVGRENRLWIAFEDGGSNWGKDYGPRLTGQGIPFYYERNILVRCLEDGELKRPLNPPRSELVYTHYDDKRYKGEFKHRISFPRLAFDDGGKLWLLYRRHPAPENVRGERWVSFARYLDGNHWSEEIRLPNSENLLDNRPAVVPAGQRQLTVVYSTDGRTQGSRSAKVNNLNAVVLSAEQNADPPVLVGTQPEGDEPPASPVDPDESENVRRCREYTITAGGKSYQLLRGEFHRHTEMSAHRDWDGAMEDAWRYALDVADMDWMGPGDHDYAVGQDYMWWLTQKEIDLYHDAPRFVSVFSYERSMRYPSGHRNVIFPERGIRPLPRLSGREKRFGTPDGGIPDIDNLYECLRTFGGICSSHTSASNMGTDWRGLDTDVEPVVEIFQGHRHNYEEPNALLAPRNAQDSIQGYRPKGFVWQALKQGIRLGFQSSSDHVSTHTSYAVVLAEEPTRRGLIDAFKKRHCYAANDNIVLDVRCGRHIMGDEFRRDEPPQLEVTAVGTAPIVRIDIVRQVGKQMPEYVYTQTPGEKRVEFRWTDEAAVKDRINMYYVRIQQEDARMAWASPMWIHYEP